LGIIASKAPVVLCIDGDIILPKMLVQQHLVHHHVGGPKIIGGPRFWRTIDIDIPSTLNPAESYLRLQRSLISLDEKARQREANELNSAANLCPENAYLSCLGFQLSFLKTKDTLFSSDFKGWGFEDRDFVLKQIKYSALQAIYDPNCQVWHLDSELRSFNLFRKENVNPELVTQFLLNLTHIVEKYGKTVNRDDLYYGLDRILYCAELDTWKLLSSDRRQSPLKRPSTYTNVVEWLYKKGYIS
jgi:hypothetical protein